MLTSIEACENSSAISCYNAGSLSPSAYARLNGALNALRSRGYRTSFVMVDLETGGVVSSGSSDIYYSASTIKGPYVCAANYGLPSKATMWIPVMERAITISSNSDYALLRSEFGNGVMDDYLSESRVSSFLANILYPYLSVKDLSKLWIRNYEYFNSGKNNAPYVKEMFTHSLNSFIYYAIGGGSTTVYSKPGWGEFSFGSVYNDSGVVTKADGHPYLMTIMSTAYERQDLLKDLVRAIDGAHDDLR